MGDSTPDVALVNVICKVRADCVSAAPAHRTECGQAGVGPRAPPGDNCHPGAALRGTRKLLAHTVSRLPRLPVPPRDARLRAGIPDEDA